MYLMDDNNEIMRVAIHMIDSSSSDHCNTQKNIHNTRVDHIILTTPLQPLDKIGQSPPLESLQSDIIVPSENEMITSHGNKVNHDAGLIEDRETMPNSPEESGHLNNLTNKVSPTHGGEGRFDMSRCNSGALLKAAMEMTSEPTRMSLNNNEDTVSYIEPVSVGMSTESFLPTQRRTGEINKLSSIAITPSGMSPSNGSGAFPINNKNAVVDNPAVHPSYFMNNNNPTAIAQESLMMMATGNNHLQRSQFQQQPLQNNNNNRQLQQVGGFWSGNNGVPANNMMAFNNFGGGMPMSLGQNVRYFPMIMQQPNAAASNSSGAPSGYPFVGGNYLNPYFMVPNNNGVATDVRATGLSNSNGMNYFPVAMSNQNMAYQLPASFPARGEVPSHHQSAIYYNRGTAPSDYAANEEQGSSINLDHRVKAKFTTKTKVTMEGIKTENVSTAPLQTKRKFVESSPKKTSSSFPPSIEAKSIDHDDKTLDNQLPHKKRKLSEDFNNEGDINHDGVASGSEKYPLDDTEESDAVTGASVTGASASLEDNGHIFDDYEAHKLAMSDLLIKCCEPGCPYKNFKPSVMLIHERYHYEIKNGTSNKKRKKHFFCPRDQCGYIANDASNMRVHERRHLGMRPFRCHVKGCNYISSHEERVESHVKRCH